MTHGIWLALHLDKPSLVRLERENCSMRQTLILNLSVIALATLMGCGKADFVKGTTAQEQASPGSFVIPAKVDLLLVEDNTPSIYEAYSAIASQIPVFLNDLESRGWDYRLATSPLVSSRSLNQILASKFDGNWHPSMGRSGWRAPYPGANPMDNLVNPSYFREQSQYSHFITTSDVVTGMGTYEPGLATIDTALNVHAANSQFLRPDAMLAVIVMGNGNDTSVPPNYVQQNDPDVQCRLPAAAGLDIGFCRRVDGFVYPSAQAAQLANVYYSGRMNNLVLTGKSASVRFYSAVAHSQVTNCLGSTSRVGSRYMQMTSTVGGVSVDLCSQGVSNVLSAISGNLQSVKLSFRTRYLVLSEAPRVDSIRVLKRPASGGEVEIPQNATNGWTYIGYRSGVNAIDYPTEMNEVSGYIIELHGSSRLIGDDTATVEYEPAG